MLFFRIIHIKMTNFHPDPFYPELPYLLSVEFSNQTKSQYVVKVLQFHLSRAVFIGQYNRRKLVWSDLPAVCSGRPCHFLARGGNLKSCKVLQLGSLVNNYGLNCGFARVLCVCNFLTVKFHWSKLQF